MRTLAALALLFVLGATTAVAVSATQSASSTLAFAGVGEDKVGTTFSNTSPNGKPDGHFTFTIDAPGETVVDIELRSAKPDGAIFGPGGEHWDTIRGGWWLVGVFRDGTLLNPRDGNLADPVSGTVTYELYAESTGHFVNGNTFRVDATFQSGRGVAAAITIGSANSWQVQSVEPSAVNAPGASPGTTVPTTAPFTTQPVPGTAPTPTTSGTSPTTTSTSTSTSTSTTPTRVALALSPTATRARVGRCIALTATLAGVPPSSAVTLLEERLTSAWRQVAQRVAGTKTRFSVCSKKAGRGVYRARLKARGAFLAGSNVASVTWK